MSTSTSTAQNVLVLGATGHIGRPIVAALQERGHQVHALVRPATLVTDDPAKRAVVSELRRRGVVFHAGGIEDGDVVSAACAATDIVVSALTGELLGAQVGLLEAMAAAGTQRFIASEYGMDPHLLDEGRCLLADWKRGIQQAVVASGVPYTFVYAQGFATYWAGSLGQIGLLAPPTDAVTVFGTGDVPAHLVAPTDIARFVAATIDDPRTENREIAISPAGNRVTQNGLIDQWEALTGASLTRNTMPAAAIDGTLADLAHQPERMVELIMLQLARTVWLDGATATRRDGVLEATSLYPDLRVTSIRDFLAGYVARPEAPNATSGALAAPVQRYLDALATGDVDALVDAFDADYRSEQPAHPGRAFSGRDTVRRSYEQLFAAYPSRAFTLIAQAVSQPDAAGVRTHWLELTYDLVDAAGRHVDMTGVTILGSTDEAIRWGRLHLSHVATGATAATGREAGMDMDGLIASSR